MHFTLSSALVIPATTLLQLLTQGVSAWHLEIHNQIGFMAEQLIKPATTSMVQDILAVEPEWQGSLGRSGAWADTVRRGKHAYSYGWHFISARDNPPDDCGLYYHRDCQVGGCVVQQISNQTRILEQCLIDSQRAKRVAARKNVRTRSKNQVDPIVCAEALKWITHFTGDVAQPLHTSERSYGGNSIKVVFNSTQTNLHQVWDREILYAFSPFTVSSPPSTSQIEPYFEDLIKRIPHDSFRSPVYTWDVCHLDKNAALHGTFCPESWAKDSNSIVCDYAYGRYVNGSDLLTGPEGYAHGAIHIVEEQLAKAAWRLSAWLDNLVERVLLVDHQHLDDDRENDISGIEVGKEEKQAVTEGQQVLSGDHTVDIEL